MELKVWVEGFPRVISGVHEQTTCRDVIRALAQALGRPGRYSLVQRWRDSERTVAPTVNLLEELRKWGEYAADVQLVLCQTDASLCSDSSSSSLADVFNRFPTPVVENGSLPIGGRRSTGPRHGDKPLANGHTGSSGGNTRNNNMRDELMRASEQVTTTSVAVAAASGKIYANHQHLRSASGSRSATPEVYGTKQIRDSGHSSLPRHSKGGVQREIKVTSSPTDIVKLNGHVKNNWTREQTANGVAVRQMESALYLSKHPAVRQDNSDRAANSVQHTEEVAQCDELMRQLAQQDDLLQRNAAQMASLDKDIAIIEETLRKAERELAYEEGTARRLEEDVEPELEELELVSWDGKLEQEQIHRQKVEEQLKETRLLVARLNTELTKILVEIKKFEKQMCDEQNKQYNRGSVNESEDKLKTLTETLSLTKKEYEANKELLEQINDEVKLVEDELVSCNSKICSLEADLTRTNLNNLNLLDKTVTDDFSSLTRTSSSRPVSSSRRLNQSPSLLKDIAPSPANPQGMWV